MATAAQLKALRKKFHLGEFGPGVKQTRRGRKKWRKSVGYDSKAARRQRRVLRRKGSDPEATSTGRARRATGRQTQSYVARAAIGNSLLANLWSKIQSRRALGNQNNRVYPGAGGAQSTTTMGSVS